jgi:archaellum component FlaC
MSQTSPSGLTPNFYPLDRLPMFSNLIDEQLEHDLAQYASLKNAEHRPHVLDDEIVNRVEKLYTEAKDLVWCYREQLNHWRKEKTTDKQLQEVERLEQQVEQLEQCRTNILSLTEAFKGKTIDTILGKSDFDLAMRYGQIWCTGQN